MNHKIQFIILILFCSLSLGVKAQSNDTIRHEVLLETSMGNIRLVLYNETPLHRDNFLRLVKEGYYDGNLFHRVISNFMIQTG
ncbi:MAG: peptidylprolyl isomerase, partial [Prevotella sp.]|nr:peptidylprolyl isomerase [Prevotella sp.]